MAWAFSDNYKTPSSIRGSDARSWAIERNDTGSNYVNTAAFDYFDDDAIADEYIIFRGGRKFWGLDFQVGTAMSASSITLVWEYYAAGSWVSLPVTNPNAFLSTGEQIVTFTPPRNWTSETYNGYMIRCRISAVSGLTEGGANATNVVAYNFKALTCTGTETTLSAAVTADLAGSYTLLPATTPAASLIPLEMPVYKLYRAEQVDCVLSGCTLGVGDTITLTGVDTEGNTITEDIDVSAGNNTYTSALAYSNITDIACTGFSDGTITVNQKSWGVIRADMAGGETYSFGADLRVGDESTATTLSLTQLTLKFNHGFYWYVVDNATFNAGTTTSGYSINGCVFIEGLYADGVYQPNWIRSWGTGSLTHYACTYNVSPGGGAQFGALCFHSSASTGTVSFIDCTFVGTANTSDMGAIRIDQAIKLVNCKIMVPTRINTNLTSGTTGLAFSHRLQFETAGTTAVVLENVSFPDCRFWLYNTSSVTLLNSDGLEDADFVIGYSGQATNNNCIRRMFTYNLTVKDSAGDPIEGATVVLVNAQSESEIADTTDVNGAIDEVNLKYKYGSIINGNATMQWTDYTPGTLLVKGYAYLPLELTKNITRETTDEVVLQADSFITETTEATAAAYTGITVNHASQLVTVSEAHSIKEVYDYLKALNVSSTAEAAYDQILTTSDGTNYQCAYDLTVDGVTLSGSGTLDLGSKTFTASNGGGTSLTVSDVSGTLVAVTLTNVVVGSRVRIEKVSDGSEILSVEAASSTVSTNFQHTIDTDVNIIVRKASDGTKYLPYSTTGTITSSGLSVRINQIEDTVIT